MRLLTYVDIRLWTCFIQKLHSIIYQLTIISHRLLGVTLSKPFSPIPSWLDWRSSPSTKSWFSRQKGQASLQWSTFCWVANTGISRHYQIRSFFSFTWHLFCRLSQKMCKIDIQECMFLERGFWTPFWKVFCPICCAFWSSISNRFCWCAAFRLSHEGCSCQPRALCSLGS